MTAQNLIGELGVNYVNEYFSEALFKYEDDYYMFVGARSSGPLDVHKLVAPNNTPESATWQPTTVPRHALKDFTTFAIPRLGYRAFKGAMTGHETIGYLSHNRSTRRGFRTNLLEAELCPAASLLTDDGNDDWAALGSAPRAYCACRPTFSSVKEGLNRLRNNEVLGVVLNPDTAIVLELHEMQDDPWSIYYKGTRVGRVSEEGVIRINNKVMNRDTFRRQLQVE